MTNTTIVPLESAYKTVLTASIDAVTTTLVVDIAPSVTVPAGKKMPAVIDPKNNFREVVFITAIVGSTLTVERGGSDYAGGPSTANAHSAGATIVITNPFNIFQDFSGAIDSKLDSDGGNPTTTWDLDVTASDFRFRLDAGDMKFTDDNQAEVSLSTLAAAAGVDDKAKVSVADTTSSYLATKIVAGAGASLNILNPAGNETLEVALDASGAGVSDHEVYTPAFLTGGNAPEIVVAIWDSVSDGAFSITIDGVTREMTGLDFQTPAVLSMADVAAVIQTGIRAVTTSTETCTWSGAEFIVTSANTTVTSTITITSTIAIPAGTDISGAGAAYMDCDAGSTAVVTAAVIDPTADAGKLVVLAASGNINGALVDATTLGLTAKGAIATASDATTKTELTVGVDGELLEADSTAPGGLAWVAPTGFATGLLAIYTTVHIHTGVAPSTWIIAAIPGGTIGANGGIRIKIWTMNWRALNGQQSILQVEYGGQLATFNGASDGDTSGAGSNNKGALDLVILGTGATNTQTYMGSLIASYPGFGINYENYNTRPYVFMSTDGNMTVDTTISQNLVIIASGTHSASTLTIEKVMIERI